MAAPNNPPVDQPEHSEYTVRLRVPHAKQILFLRSKAKRIIIRAGRRGGKTTGMGIFAVRRFLRGRRVLYAAPTGDQIARFWAEIKYALADPIKAGVYKKNETEHWVELPGTEQRIRAKTAWNADTLRGDYADDLILDEFQLMDETAWTEVGSPMLIDNNGDAIFIYTPPSRKTAAQSRAKDKRYAAKLFKRAASDPSGRWAAFHFTSYDNPHVSAEGLAEVSMDMSALARRQEILAEDVDEVPGALWTLKMIDDLRVPLIPEGVSMSRVVVGIDPSGGSTNEAGVAAVGLGSDGHAYVLRDGSVLAASPRQWATSAVNLYHELRADRILGERNYGGDMVEETVRAVDQNVSYKDVNATRGKAVRAEPCVAFYERGLVHHVGEFPQMEEEMCSYVPGDKRSPNRMDAVVWCLTDLLVGSQTLGLIEWLKSGGAQREIERLQGKTPEEVAAGVSSPVSASPSPDGNIPPSPSPVLSSTQSTTGPAPSEPSSAGHAMDKSIDRAGLGKVEVNDQTPRCPTCNFHGLQDIPGGQKRCSNCGHQFWPGKQPPILQPASRRDFLK
jgi:hypothetical protein